MAQDNRVNLPAGFGGLTRFTEEYTSKIMIRPSHVIIFVALIVAFRVAMPYIFQ